jgi:hypothetical protein
MAQNSKEIEIDEMHSFVKIKKNWDNLSILEQNSLSVAMDLLISPKKYNQSTGGLKPTQLNAIIPCLGTI